MQLCYI